MRAKKPNLESREEKNSQTSKVRVVPPRKENPVSGTKNI